MTDSSAGCFDLHRLAEDPRGNHTVLCPYVNSWYFVLVCVEQGTKIKAWVGQMIVLISSWVEFIVLSWIIALSCKQKKLIS